MTRVRARPSRTWRPIGATINAAEEVRDALDDRVERTATDPGAAFAPEIRRPSLGQRFAQRSPARSAGKPQLLDILQNPAKSRFGGTAHRSISVQEGQPVEYACVHSDLARPPKQTICISLKLLHEKFESCRSSASLLWRNASVEVYGIDC
jgi:hypothetical protein